MKTNQQYDTVIAGCRNIYLNKIQDYGASWRVLRTISIADQIFIKAWRIRQIQEKRLQKIDDGIDSELKAIVNYGIIGLIQLEIGSSDVTAISAQEAQQFYDRQSDAVKKLMLDKNHDYGEAWRDMSQQSFVDLILTKLLRIKQILSNDGKTIISEGMDANFADIVNYAVFALIKLQEESA